MGGTQGCWLAPAMVHMLNAAAGRGLGRLQVVTAFHCSLIPARELHAEVV
jgi:hypothetical protein